MCPVLCWNETSVCSPPQTAQPAGTRCGFRAQGTAAQPSSSRGWCLKITVCGLHCGRVSGLYLGQNPHLSCLLQEQAFGGKITLQHELDNVAGVCGLIPLMLFKALFSHYPLCAELQSTPLKITAATWINWLGNISSASPVPQQNAGKPRKMLAQIWNKFCLEASSLRIALQTNPHIRGAAGTALVLQEKKKEPAGLQGSETVACQILIYLTASVIK